jgi:hypothetical protein
MNKNFRTMDHWTTISGHAISVDELYKKIKRFLPSCLA